MFKSITKIVIASLVALGACGSAFSIELKLACKIDVVRTFISGDVERKRYNEIFEVLDLGNYISIGPQTDDFMGVVAGELVVLKFNNFSNSSKWDILNRSQDSRGKISEVRITIDRNTGKLFYSETWDGRAIVIKGNGTCEKIDQAKRKF